MSAAASQIREASHGDRPQLSAALAEAFFDDPVAAWAIRPEDLRTATLTNFYDEFLRQNLRHGTVWCDDALTGAAIWAPPGEAKVSAADTVTLLRRLFHPRLAWRLPLLAWGAFKTEGRHPERDFFYLAALGVHPNGQGQGLGSKLLGPMLEVCDEDRVAAYLESSKPENVPFYSRHGFRVVDQLTMPRGPEIWLMLREPA